MAPKVWQRPGSVAHLKRKFREHDAEELRRATQKNKPEPQPTLLAGGVAVVDGKIVPVCDLPAEDTTDEAMQRWGTALEEPHEASSLPANPEVAFRRDARKADVNPDAFNKVVEVRTGKMKTAEFRVVGVKPSARKNPLLVERVTDLKRFKLPASAADAAVAGKMFEPEQPVAGPDVTDEERAAWLKHAAALGLADDLLGATIEIKAVRYVVKSINPRAPKFCVLAWHTYDMYQPRFGKPMALTAQAVKDALVLKRPLLDSPE